MQYLLRHTEYCINKAEERQQAVLLRNTNKVNILSLPLRMSLLKSMPSVKDSDALSGTN